MSDIWFTRPDPAAIDAYHVGTTVEHLGITFTEVGGDFLRARMTTDHMTRQPYGTIHGGVNLVLAETLGSVGAAHCVDPARFRVFGQEINGNHLRPNFDGWVTGTARPFHLGRSSHVWGIEIANSDGKLTCVARITMAVVAIERS